MTGYQAPKCECGHAVGEHKGGARGAMRAPTFGVCLAPGCSCREFVEVKIEKGTV